MKKKHYLLLLVLTILLTGASYWDSGAGLKDYKVGQVIDEFNGEPVYYNGLVGNVSGRNLAQDDYNLGLQYQCVEFVKRYYYHQLGHRMPNSYGHAKNFYDAAVADGQKNGQRNLLQFSNPSTSKPRPEDLLVFKSSFFSKYGHVAIVSKVGDHEIEIVQQNAGFLGSSRERFMLKKVEGKWKIAHPRIVGWLRR